MQKGFIAISSVIIVASVVLAISISTTYLMIGEGQSSLASTKGEEVLVFVENCMEDALLKIRNAPTYSGGTIFHPSGTCDITVNRVSNNYTITATSTSFSHVRTIEVQATRTNQLTITSWKEI